MEIHHGDNLQIMRGMEGESIDLIATDPPFNTGRDFGSYDDRRGDGFIDWLMERVQEMHRLLKPTGSLYLQCDSHESHYIKVALDGIFGRRNFLNEIVWRRSDPKNNATRKYSRMTDRIFFYAKDSSQSIFHVEHKDGVKNKSVENGKAKTRVEPETGREYWLSDLSAPGNNADRLFEFQGVSPGRNWRWTKERMTKAWNNGELEKLPKGGIYRKVYMDEMKGPVVGDLWDDIARLNNSGNERVGYPTQKPLALYRRIIEASSKEGDVVFDPFTGCGTTLVAAQQLGRQWIGCDVNEDAIKIAQERLA